MPGEIFVGNLSLRYFNRQLPYQRLVDDIKDAVSVELTTLDIIDRNH